MNLAYGCLLAKPFHLIFRRRLPNYFQIQETVRVPKTQGLNCAEHVLFGHVLPYDVKI